MEKGRGKRTDTLQTDKVFTRKEYIEREKVVELLNKWADGYSYIEVPTKDAIACVRAIPAADVVPVRHGRWIEKRWSTEDDWSMINWHSLTCSACCHEERTNGLSPNSIYKYDCCPHCGARMDGDGDA